VLNSESIFQKISGVTPYTWLLIDTGISREDFKDQALLAPIGFTSNSVSGWNDILTFCLKKLNFQHEMISQTNLEEVLLYFFRTPQIQSRLALFKKFKT
jgi:hypothetical protein